MSNKEIDSLAMIKAGLEQSIKHTDKVLNLLEAREMSKREPGAYPRNVLPSPIAHEHIKHVSDTFGVNRHTGRGWYAHNGIDIAVQEHTELLAPVVCKVKLARSYPRSYGNRVDLQIMEGPFKGYIYSLCHCYDFIPGLEVGSFCNKGDLVAWTGNTGNSTGPHLHLMIGTNLGSNGYAVRSDLTSTIGFVDPLGCFDFEGCRWG